MRIRLYILIIITLLIVAAAIVSILIYRHGLQNQFDEYIIIHSAMKGEPGLSPVDPAIVKALISLRSNFTSRIALEEGQKGLMLIPKEGAEKYMDFHGAKDYVMEGPEKKKEFTFICPNRNFPNHKDHQDNTKSIRVLCPVCKTRTIEAILDAEINIRIGAWYLSFINAYLRENIEGITDSEALDFSLFIFETGIETHLTYIKTRLTEQYKRDISDDDIIGQLKPYLKSAMQDKSVTRRIQAIKQRAKKYRPGLQQKARAMGIDEFRYDGGNEPGD